MKGKERKFFLCSMLLSPFLMVKQVYLESQAKAIITTTNDSEAKQA